jgi:hypothetical protein
MAEQEDKIEEMRRKVKKAAQLLLFQRHRLPGVRGWELRRALGGKFTEILKLLNSQLEPLGLEVKSVFESGQPEKPTMEDMERARFYIVLAGSISPSDVQASGWRIDEVAALASTIALIISRQGKVPRKEVEDVLREKFLDWKVELGLERFIRLGYLHQSEDGMLFLGWRTRAEVDERALINMILGAQETE